MAEPKRFLERNLRPTGDLFAPWFQFAFFNTTGEKTEVNDVANRDDLINNLFREDAAASPLAVITGTAGLGASVRVGQSPATGRNPAYDAIEDLVLKVGASFTAEVIASGPYKFTLTLTPEYEDGLILLNERILGYATLAQVKWGYLNPGGEPLLTEKHTFRNIYPEARFGEDISIVISGHDLISDSAMRKTTGKTWKKKDNTSVFKIIQELVKNANSNVEVLEAETQREIGAEHPIFKSIQQSITQNIPDWAMIHSLLRKVGLTFRIVQGTKMLIYDITKPQKRGAGPYTFKFRQQLTGAYDIPCYSVTGNYLPSFFQPPAGRGLMSITYDPEKKIGSQVDAKFVDSRDVKTTTPKVKKETPGASRDQTNVFKSPRTNKVNAKDGASHDATTGTRRSTDTQETGGKHTGPPQRGNATDASVALIKEHQLRSHPKVKISCPGHPDVFPGLVVLLEGAAIFDRPYTILGVKHKLSTSGYDMDVDLIMWSQPRKDAPNSPTNDVTKKKDGTQTTAPRPVAGEGKAFRNSRGTG